MTAVVPHRIELFAGHPPAEDVSGLLADAGYEFGVRQFHDAHAQAPADLYVVDGGKQPEAALRQCRRLRHDEPEGYTPILFVTAGADGPERLASLESGADTALGRPLQRAEFLAQVQSLLRVKERHDQLSLKAADAQRVSKRLQAATQQMDQELELARRLQESFLPQDLPAVPGVKLAVKYKPAALIASAVLTT
jgi:DNA-binding response OmpR family regulator